MDKRSWPWKKKSSEKGVTTTDLVSVPLSTSADNQLDQNSWTKRPVEVESLPLLSPSDQPADQHDSPCAQITPPETEAICKGWVPMTDNSEYKEHNEIADVYMGKDLEIGVPMNPGLQHETYPTEKVSTKLTSESVERLPESDSNNKGMLGLESSNLSLNKLQSSYFCPTLLRNPSTIPTSYTLM